MSDKLYLCYTEGLQKLRIVKRQINANYEGVRPHLQHSERSCSPSGRADIAKYVKNLIQSAEL